jgi:plasmid stabilization system protein ParE
MTLKLELHPAAVAELRAARLWYRARDPVVAVAFTAEYKRAVARIAAEPERWPRFLHATRRHRLRGFPYVVVYRASKAGILILAVAHERRAPDYWATRS